MSKYLHIFGGGHGGLDPDTGKYVTPGKRSPLFDNKTFDNEDPYSFYEGVNNRDNVQRIIAGLKEQEIECVDIINDWRDVSLSERCRRINKLAEERDCIFYSVHSNGHRYEYIDKKCTIRYNRRVHDNDIKRYTKKVSEWTAGKGTGVYHYTKASQMSRKVARIVANELICEFDGISNWRGIKARNFAMLRETRCPAILLELGFHTNKKETLLMMGEDWKNRVVRSMVSAIQQIESI